MNTYTVTKVTEPVTLGEGPHWDYDTKSLYFVDIVEEKVHKYVPSTNKHTSTKVDGGAVSFVIPLKGQKDKFVISVGRSIAVMTWDGESAKPSGIDYIIEVDKEEAKATNRFNDGKADPTGRLWAGTMGPIKSLDAYTPERGALFSITKRGAISQLQNISVANGLAWSLDMKTMYYIDSMTFKVDALDYNAESGKISNRRAVFDLKKNGIEGLPDGMTIDSEGMLWVACYAGAQVIRVDPNKGTLLRQVPIPAMGVTSVSFGGPNLDILYVTTANVETGEKKEQYPLAGCTFQVKELGVRGYPGQSATL